MHAFFSSEFGDGCENLKATFTFMQLEQKLIAWEDLILECIIDYNNFIII